MQEIKGHALALGVLVVGLMEQRGLLNLEPDVDIDQLTMELELFIQSNQDLALQLDFLVQIETFMTKFCPEVCQDLGICQSLRANMYLNELR